MLIKSFIRKKSTRIYFIIISLFICMIYLFSYSKAYYILKNNDTYGDSSLVIESKKILDFDGIKNIKSITKNIEDDTYIYKIDLKNWSIFTKTSIDIKKNLNVDVVENVIKINSKDYSILIIVFNIFTHFSIVLLIIIIIISIVNIVLDEQKNCLLYKYLGYSFIRIIINEMVKISLFIMASLMTSFSICILIRFFLILSIHFLT